MEISQGLLAKRLGAQIDTIRNWERDRTSPALRYLPAIIEFLGYDPARSEPKTVGERLLKYRRDRGISQKDLARQIGIDPTTLSRIERNARNRIFRNVLLRLKTFISANVA